METRPTVPLEYGREEQPDPLGEVQIERFPDGGVTIRAPAKTGRGGGRAVVLVDLVVFSGVLMFLAKDGFLHRPSPFLVLGVGAFLVLYAARFRHARRWEDRSRRPEVVGVSARSVYVDLPAPDAHCRKSNFATPGEPFEVPRRDLIDVRLTRWSGKGNWSRGVQLHLAGRAPVEFCHGLSERQIWAVFRALKQAMADTAE